MTRKGPNGTSAFAPHRTRTARPTSDKASIATTKHTATSPHPAHASVKAATPATATSPSPAPDPVTRDSAANIAVTTPAMSRPVSKWDGENASPATATRATAPETANGSRRAARSMTANPGDAAAKAHTPMPTSHAGTSSTDTAAVSAETTASAIVTRTRATRLLPRQSGSSSEDSKANAHRPSSAPVTPPIKPTANTITATT